MQQQFARLNELFYSASPADHFRTRLRHLMVAAVKGPELQALVGSGIQMGDLELQAGDDLMQGLGDYVTTESHALLHHASESLLRLFLAHIDTPPCPWVEVLKESDFRAFKRKVKLLTSGSWPPEFEASLLPIFLGRSEATSDELGAARHALKRLLRILAARLLEDATLYNSVKHGFAARAGRHTLTVGDDRDEFALTQTGETVTFLEFRWLQGGGRRWQTTTT